MVSAEARATLERMLRTLETHFGFAHDLKIEWYAGENFGIVDGKTVKGTVVNGTIRIWTADFETAKEVLVHEFIEWILTEEFTQPYDDIINRLLKHFEDQTYWRRERLVRRITNFVLREIAENGE